MNELRFFNRQKTRALYMPLLRRPEKIYGTNIGSSYQHQALTLSKQFRKS